MSPRITRLAGALLVLLAAGAGYSRVAAQQVPQQPSSTSEGRFLGREEIRLYGLNLTVAPAEQVVPKDMATIVSTFLQTPTPPPGQTLSPFAPDAEVRATLRGPSLPAPVELAVKPGNPFNIPALKIAGVHTLENIRLVSNGEVLLRGTPENARIEVIEKLLVSQVTARPLTADEIREKGIVFDRSNFQAYNFTAAFAIQDNPIAINFPVLLPRLLGAEAPTNPIGSLPSVPVPSIPRLETLVPDTLQLQTKLPNLQVVGFSLKVPQVKDGNLIVPPIPGIIAIPGDIGFLNQYFSVMLMVGNVAPQGSALVVTDLAAEIVLPAGRDNVPLTPDDPLRMAMTAKGEVPRTQFVTQPGPDSKLGTADDIRALGPGQSGNAEYLVEGRREGSHIVEMRMKGTLNGLPIGPVEVTGSAVGSVLVRNPTFALTFTHPEIVSAGEEYTLDVTVTNTSASPANFVSLNLQAGDIGGATLVGDASQEIDSILPGDSATVSFALKAKLTGRVFAATLDADEGVSGSFGLKTSVGELGVPLSPDSLVLPNEASELPKPLRDAAIGLLGKAWAVATAPPAAVPADLTRFSRKIVLDRAVEVAEAGLRVQLQEPLDDSAAQLAMDFLGSNFPRLPQRTNNVEALAFEQNNYRGFDLLRRLSIRGDVFADEVAKLLQPRLASMGASAFHEDVTEKISYRPGVLSVLASANGVLPVQLAIVDASGRGTGGVGNNGKVNKGIPFSDVLRFRSAPQTVSAELALVAAPESGLFTIRLTPAPGVALDAPFTLSVVVPTADGQLRQITFNNVMAGKKPVIAFADSAPYRVAVEWANVPATVDVTGDNDSMITDPPPSVISVIQRAAADQIVCDTDQLVGPRPGRIIAVLFSEEVTPASVQDRAKLEAITNYSIPGNAVVGVALQPGRRIAYLALRDPFGPLVPRSLSVNGVADLRGNVITSQALPITPKVEDDAGTVSGQVLRADGTPAPFANVRLFYRSPCNDMEVSWIGISSKTTDAQGRFSWDFVLTALPARIVAVDSETGDVRDVRFHVRNHGQQLNVNVVFLGRGTFTGRTLAADGGTPLKETFVRVTSLTDQSQYSARSDAAGRFTITGVPVGNFVVDAVNTSTVARTTVSDFIPFAGATTTQDLILLDASSEPITIKRGTINGFVLEEEGDPAIGVPVIAYYQSMSQSNIPCPKAAPECAVAVANTDSQGHFEFEDIVAGSLRLQTFNPASFEQGQVGVIVAEGQTLSANIVLGGGLGTVHGIVLDPAGRAVAGAQVGGGLSLATTNAEGRFTLRDVPVGRREIVAVSSTLGSRARVFVDLLYTGQEVNATLVLDAMASVSGVVTRSTGAPVLNVPVYVFKKEGQSIQVLGTATTNGQGGYRVDGIPLGEYRVSAFSSDFSDGNIVPAVLKFHGQVVRADVQFRGGGGRVTGHVYAEDGKTPLRARVGVSAEQVVVAGGLVGVEFKRIENFRIVDTNLQTGRYEVTGLFVGPFTVRAAGAFSPDPVALDSTMPAPGQEVQVNLRLQPTSQLTGTVFMPDGVTPVAANVAVHFKSDSVKTICTENSIGETICESFPQGVQDADAVTNDFGAFTFPLLNAGKYTLTVDGPGGRRAIAKGNLAAGQQGRHDIRLLGRADITVKVRAGDATTVIPGARVEVMQVGTPTKRVTFTADQNGVATFTGADAFSEGEVVVLATDVRNGASGRARGRLLASEQPIEVNVFLDTAVGVVFGRVVRPDGFTPVPNAEVVITRNSDAIAFALTDAQGKYREVGIPLGEVKIDVFDAATGRRGSAAGQIATNGAQIELNVTQEAIGVVRGQLVAAVTLQPLAGWRVTLGGTTASGRSMPGLVTTTSFDGSFAFPGTPLGRFTINAVKPGQPGSGSAQGILVAEGQLVEIPVIATIPRTAEGRIEGTVVDHVGGPVGNARVEVKRSGANLPEVVTADATGRFTFGPTPLGRYQIRAIRQGSNDSGSSAVDVLFDAQTAFTSVVLNGLSTVTGIVMQNGSPVPNAPVSLSGQPQTTCEGSCSGFAGPDGRFKFERVSARTVTIVASTVNNSLRGSASDVLNPGQEKFVTVTLEATRALTGRILDGQGQPLAGVVGELTIGQRQLFAESSPDGTFEYLAAPLGDFRLDLRDATGPGMASRRGTVANDVALGDITLDEAPPSVLSVTPLPSAVAVPRTQPITLLFSEPVDRASINSQSVTLVGASGAVLLDLPVYKTGDTEVTFQPVSPLQSETLHTLTVNGVRDRAGRTIQAPFTMTFKTVDVTAPTMLDVSPAANANGVTAFTTIRVRFSEPVAPEKFSQPVFELTQGSGEVEGRVDFILGNTVAVFTPKVPLDEDSSYRVRMSPAVDLSGNHASQGLDYVFSTTDRTPPQILGLVAAGNGTVIENGFTEVEAGVGSNHDVLFVDFYLNDQIAFTARKAPFKILLQAVPALGGAGSSIKVSALATDTSGNRSATPVSLLVPVTPDASPSATLLEPANGGSVPSGSTLTIKVRSTDDVSVARLGYRVTINGAVSTGSQAVLEATRDATHTFQYQVPTSAAPGATVRIEPTAIDSKGQAIVGVAVELRVLDSAPPTVAITGLTSGARVRPGQTTTVVVSAEDAGLVKTVTFAASGAASFTQTRTIDPAQASVATSFTFTVPASAKGTESITLSAFAVDGAGNRADAANVIVPVADVVAPTVALRTSNGSDRIVPGSPVTVIIDANDELGVARVELTGSGARTVAEGRTIDPPAPTVAESFTILIPDTVPPGATLQLQARALDAAENVSTPATLVLTAANAVNVQLPASLIVDAGSTKSIDVTLAAAAGPGGVRVDLSTLNSQIATVTSPVLFAQGEITRSASVTGVAGGSTELIAKVQDVERDRMTVTVQGGIVTGIVRDPDQQPVSGAQVTVEGGTTRTAETDGTGRFTVQGITASSVRIRALHAESGLYGVSQGTMAQNGFLSLDVQLIDAGSITGIVRQPNGDAVGAGVQVAIFTPSGQTPEQVVFTNEHGNYEFALVAVGQYRLDASDTAGNRGRSTVSVAGGQQLEQDIVFLSRGNVKGVVVTVAEQPVAGAELTFKASSLFGSITVTGTSGDEGEFEFSDVFAGTFTIEAKRTGTGEAGVASGSIQENGSTVNVTVTLSPVGSLEGTVRRADDSTVSGATVSVGARTTSTNEDGEYSFDFMPIGSFTATATVEGTREVGIASGTIVAGQTTTKDIALLPQGRLSITVSDDDGQPVGNASVSVSVNNGSLSDSLSGTTGSNGIVIIDHVMTGNYTVTATAGALSANVSGTLGAGETKSIALTLRSLNSVTGTVYLPGGQQPATAGKVGFVGSSSKVTDIAADGTYTLLDVTDGTYTLYANDATGRRRALAKITVPKDAGTITRDLEFVGVGTVKGRVLNGSAGVPKQTVSVVSQHPTLGHTVNVTTDGAGFYLAENIVQGPVFVSSGSNPLRGEASGVLDRADVPLTLDILLTNNATTLPRSLYDANGSRFEMQMDGGLGVVQSGLRNAFVLDIIKDGQPVRFVGEGVPTIENAGREIATRQNNLGGLNVTRKLFVPSTGYFGRWIEVLSNPTGAPITVGVRITSVVGPNAGTHPVTSVIQTSSGDEVLDVTTEQPDRWLVVDDATDVDPNVDSAGVPAVAFVFDGSGALRRAADATHTVDPSSATQKNVVQYTWQDVTVPAGQSIALMHFGVRQMGQAAAIASADRLAQLPPEALAALNPDEIPIISNFAVPADGNSVLEPLPPVNGTVAGIVLAGDGETPVKNSTSVKFKSDSLFYGRTYAVSSNTSDGSFTLQSVLGNTSPIGISVGDGFTLNGRHPETQIDAPEARGAFVDGEQTATANLVFGGTGVVSGDVRRHTGALVTSGSVTLLIPGRNVQRTLSGSSRFTYTGIPPGTATLKISHTPSGGGSALTGSVEVTVLADQKTEQDLFVEPTGGLTGLVKTSTGGPAVGVTVTVSRSGFARTRETDTGGSYTFLDLPLGSFTVSAQEPVTNLSSSTTATVVQDITTPVAPLTLIGHGTVTLQVKYGSGLDVGSGVSVQFRESARGTAVRGTSTNINGQVIMNDVAAGPFVIRAIHPADTSQFTELAGTMEHGQNQKLTISLPKLGKVTAHVRYPGLIKPGVVLVDMLGDVTRTSLNTNGDGDITFNNVPGGKSFTIRAYTSSNRVIYGTSEVQQITADNETLDVNVTLPALATLDVTVMQGEQVATGARVAIKNAFASSFTNPVTVNASGVASFTNVPQGVVQIRVTNSSNAILAMGEATVTADDHGKAVNVTINAGATLPRSLTDANGFVFDITTTGKTAFGTIFNEAGTVHRAYDSGIELRLFADGTPVPFSGNAVAQLEADGRELVIRDSVGVNLAGLEVTRKVFVPALGYFARYLELLHNPSSAPVTIDVEVASDLDSENATRIVDETPGEWMVTDDDSGNDPWPSTDPSLAHIFGRAGTLDPPAVTAPTAAADTLSYRWSSITIPPGETVALMHFAVQQPTQTAAQASAVRLAQLPPEALEDLSAAEITAIGNFNVPDDGVGTVTPLLIAPSFTLTGNIFTWNGTTATNPRNVVTLRSSNPIFSKEAKATINATTYSVTTLVADGWSLETSNLPPAPFDGWQTSRMATGAITAGQTSAIENVVFADTGSISGRVHFGNDAPVTSGTLTFSLASKSASISGLTNGAFALPVIPPGNYTMSVDANGRTATTAFSVVANAETTVDLRLPAVASVRVQVNNPNGTPATSPRLSIAYQGGVQTQFPASGQFTFAGVGEGDFSIFARENLGNGMRMAEGTGLVGAQDEAKTLDVTVTLNALATLRVLVTRAGVPVADAPVEIKHSQSDSFASYGKTNGQGIVLAANVPSGAYQLRVRNTGGTAVTGSASGTIPLSADNQTVDVPVQLTTDTVSLQGALVAGDGITPLRGYQTRVRLFDGDVEIGEQITSEGSYAFTEVPRPASGTLRLRVHYRQWSSNFIDDDVTIATGATTTHNVTVPISGITGQVVFWDPSVPHGSDIRVQIDGDDDEVWIVSDEEGRFSLFDVPAGGFVMTAFNWTFGNFYTVAAGTISGATDVVNKDLVFGRIEGTVSYADGSVAPNPAVFATQTVRPGLTITYDAAFTAANGTFEIIGPAPGAVEVTAQKLMLEGISEGQVPVPPGVADIDVELEIDGIVTGTIRDRDNALLANTAVVLSIDGLDRSTTTDDNGEFRFEHVKLGPFAVQARVGSGQATQYVTDRGTLTTDPQTGILHLRFPSTGSVSGQVIAEGGGAAADAEVIIENSDHTGPFGRFTQTLTANGSGLFSTTDIPVGQLRVSAFSGIFGGWNNVTLTAGAPASVEVQIGSLVKLTPPFVLASDAFRFDVNCQGRVVTGGRAGDVGRTYNHAYLLAIDGGAFPCITAATFEENRRELALDGTRVGTVQITRKVYVPETGGFARYLEVLTNTGSTARTVRVEVSGGIGSYSNVPQLVVSPYTTGQTYGVTRIPGAGALGFVFGGQGAAVRAADFWIGSDISFYYAWDITVPAGGTAILMHFAQQDALSDTASAHSQELASLTRAGMLNGMTAQEKAQVVNFKLQ